MKKIILIFALFSTIALSAQRNKDGNRIGISGGITQTTVTTNNFNTTPELGFVGGLSVRGNFYNDFSMIFGMQFFESNFSTKTIKPTSFAFEDVKYKMMGVQIKLLLSYNIIQDHLAIDLGPVLQVNDKLKYNKSSALNIISGTALQADQVVDISKINGNLYAGISGGTKIVKLVLSYQYGVNNFMNGINKKEESVLANGGKEFSGHYGIIGGQLMINL